MIYKDFYHFLLVRFAEPVKLMTDIKKKSFTIYAQQERLLVKNAKGNVRSLDKAGVEAFIARFEETGSTAPGDYQEITFHSSYLLAAMKHLAEEPAGKKVVIRFHAGEEPESELRYRQWLIAHPDGFVLNLLKSSEGKNGDSVFNSTCLHTTRCISINNEQTYSQPQPFTGGDYFKICAENLSVLESEARSVTKLIEIKRCQRCLGRDG